MAYAAINGQRLYFEDSGGEGSPLVMMHGFLMDHTLFDHQVSELVPKYRCIRFDARAFGKTEWDEKPFSLYDTVSDCVGLMDFLAIKSAVIVGMSQGGFAALRLALTHPERVRALVLMSTQSGVDDQATIAQYQQMRDTWVENGPVQPLIEGFATVLLGPKTTPGMDAIWNQWLPKWRTLSKNAIFHGMNNLLMRDDITSVVSSIKKPALVTHGDADIGLPISLGKALSDRLPDSKKFVTVKGAAHAANFTQPHVINESLIDFLEFIDQVKRPTDTTHVEASV